MPRKRGKKNKKSESTSIIAALVATRSDASVRQLYPTKVSSDQIGQMLPQFKRPKHILALGKHLYIFTIYDNLEEPMEFHRMQLSEGDQTWNQLTPMPTPRNQFAAAAFNGKIYFVGGKKKGMEVANTVERYCPDNGKWETIESLLAPRSLSCLVVCQDRLYCVGGFCPNGDTAKSVQMFDPRKDTKKKTLKKKNGCVWEYKEDMLCPRQFFSIVAVGGNIYVLGGVLNTLSLNSVEMYKTDENSWILFETMKMTVPRDNFSACVWRGKIVIAGGDYNWPKAETKHNVRFNHKLRKGLTVPKPKLKVVTDFMTEKVTSVEMYDFEKESWETLCSTSRHPALSTYNILVVL